MQSSQNFVCLPLVCSPWLITLRLFSTYLSWVNLQRKPCSHELFISYFNTFLFVLTNCFMANQITDTVVKKNTKKQCTFLFNHLKDGIYFSTLGHAYSFNEGFMSEWMSKWLLFNANSTFFQLYHGKNMLNFNEMIMRSALY